MMQEAIERIRQMENAFDRLMQAETSVLQDPCLAELLRALIRYYESGQWLSDYELDEQGLLPQNYLQLH